MAMIQLRSEAITVTDGDGASEIFDPEDLELRLARCCRAAGWREPWLPEDLALAVEDALLHAGDRRTYGRDEINVFVVKVLRDLGLGEVAEHFRLATRPAEDRIAPGAPGVRDLLIRHLGLPDSSAGTLAAETSAACRTLGLADAPPPFLVELARLLRERREETPSLPSPAPFRRSAATASLVTRAEILAQAPPETVALMDAGILAVQADISRLFPAIKLDLHWCRLAESRAWTPPVTELTVVPLLPGIAAAMAPLATAARAAARAQGHGETLPIVLRCPDLPRFATAWLGVDWPGGAGIAHALLAEIAACLPPPVRHLAPPARRRKPPQPGGPV
jgi:hypothetical protein